MRIAWPPMTTAPRGSKIKKTMVKCRAGCRTKTSWSCRGRSRAWPSAAITTSCSPKTCSGRSQTGSRAAVRRTHPRCCRSQKTIRPTERCTTQATPKTCRSSSTQKAATGITRTRARSPQPASPTRPGARRISRTIAISAWPSNREWARTTPRQRCASGAASTPSIR